MMSRMWRTSWENWQQNIWACLTCAKRVLAGLQNTYIGQYVVHSASLTKRIGGNMSLQDFYGGCNPLEFKRTEWYENPGKKLFFSDTCSTPADKNTTLKTFEKLNNLEIIFNRMRLSKDTGIICCFGGFGIDIKMRKQLYGNFSWEP